VSKITIHRSHVTWIRAMILMSSCSKFIRVLCIPIIMYTNNYSNIEISDIVIGKNKMVQFFCLTVYNSYY